MKNIIISITILAILLIISSCGSSGDKFEGDWIYAQATVSQQSCTITHINNNEYLISIPGNLQNQSTGQNTSPGSSMNYSLKDGKLEAMGGLSTIVYNNGDLIFDGRTYSRPDPNKKIWH